MNQFKKTFYTNRVWRYQGLKKIGQEIGGRDIPSVANSMLSEFPLTVTVTTQRSSLFCFLCAYVNFRLTLLFLPLLLSSSLSQGVVPVRHQLPRREAQQPRRVGDQTGNGAGKQFPGSDVPEKGLLHSRRVGQNLTFVTCFQPTSRKFIGVWENMSECIKSLKRSVASRPYNIYIYISILLIHTSGVLFFKAIVSVF